MHIKKTVAAVFLPAVATLFAACGGGDGREGRERRGDDAGRAGGAR